MLRCEKNNNQSGFALIIVLIFLQIIALLGIYSVESVIQAEKMSRLNAKQVLTFIQAEQILSLIEKNFLKTIPSCIIPQTPPSVLMSEPFNWWQSQERCAGIFQLFQYYYVIEKLDVDACIKMTFLDPDRHDIGKYYRITLLTIDKKNEAREMLQSTIITLDNTLQRCDSDEDIFIGRQMWRELR